MNKNGPVSSLPHQGIFLTRLMPVIGGNSSRLSNGLWLFSDKEQVVYAETACSIRRAKPHLVLSPTVSDPLVISAP